MGTRRCARGRRALLSRWRRACDTRLFVKRLSLMVDRIFTNFRAIHICDFKFTSVNIFKT
ncbi:hypothetical protein EVAR_103905_1, partial [Eumeta japonica]